MFHIPAHKQGSTAPAVEFKAPAVAEVICPTVAHVQGDRKSTYRGKYPKRIAVVSGPSKVSGLYLQANDGTTVRMDNDTAYALCVALGKTKNGPQINDDITPWLPARAVDLANDAHNRALMNAHFDVDSEV